MEQNNMFENFEEFKEFIQKEGKNIKNWPIEQVQAFTQNVMDRIVNDEEFKTKYEAWANNLAHQAEEKKGKPRPITLDAKESSEIIRNQIKLQQIRKHRAAQNIKIIDKPKKDKAIVIGGTDKDNQENKAKLENMKKTQKALEMGIAIKKKKYRI